MPLVSLCIPTNGKSEWVLPVLDSIYLSNVDESLFEVVVEDNGDNDGFESLIESYQSEHINLKYFKSNSQGFLCQIDSFKHASGDFIKFVNHRSRFVDGALQYFISFANDNIDSKPIAFFSNGSVKACECSSFDDFVKSMSYYSSWSNGISFWKEDINDINSIFKFNSLFPHTDILFMKRNAEKYIISSQKVFEEIYSGHESKGKYNLFYAFAVEYPAIICNLLRDQSISVHTYNCFKNDLLSFIADLYIQFIIKREPASYSFQDYKSYIKVNYSNFQFKLRLIKRLSVLLIHKVSRIFGA